jgi:large subunit ribosomal protein L5
MATQKAEQKEKTKKSKKGDQAPVAKADKKKKGAEAGKKKKGAEAGVHAAGPIPRVKTYYEEKVAPEMLKAFDYGNVMQVPRMTKIVVNMGVGEALQNPKALDAAQADLTAITGQKAVVRRARKSIANFKLRAGQAIGCSVTLRGNLMYEFYDRLISVAIPRVRDFRGTPTRSFDGRGNYTFGLTEQIVFPEIDYDKVEKIRGMDITIVTSASTDEEGRELMKLMKMPFRAR